MIPLYAASAPSFRAWAAAPALLTIALYPGIGEPVSVRIAPFWEFESLVARDRELRDMLALLHSFQLAGLLTRNVHTDRERHHQVVVASRLGFGLLVFRIDEGSHLGDRSERV